MLKTISLTQSLYYCLIAFRSALHILFCHSVIFVYVLIYMMKFPHHPLIANSSANNRYSTCTFFHRHSPSLPSLKMEFSFYKADKITFWQKGDYTSRVDSTMRKVLRFAAIPESSIFHIVQQMPYLFHDPIFPPHLSFFHFLSADKAIKVSHTSNTVCHVVRGLLDRPLSSQRMLVKRYPLQHKRFHPDKHKPDAVNGYLYPGRLPFQCCSSH